MINTATTFPGEATIATEPPQTNIAKQSLVEAPLPQRIGRAAFIARFVVMALVLSAIASLGGSILVQVLSWANGLESAAILFYGPIICLILFVIGYSIALAAKRMHDTGHSGFWLLFMSFPVVVPFFMAYLVFTPGHPEANEFGPPTLAPKTWEKNMLWLAGVLLVSFIGFVIYLVVDH